MLTPYFELSQTETSVVLIIKAPMANIGRTELEIDEEISLPKKLLGEEAEAASFNSDTGEFTFTLRKANVGEHFEDLDLIGKLLTPTPKYQIRPDIQVCDEVVPSSDPESDGETTEDWLIKQELPQENPAADLPRYGFANKTQGHGRELRMEFFEIVDLVDVEKTPASERSLLREAEELVKFSDDHYLADLMEPGCIAELIQFRAPWEHAVVNGESVTLTKEEAEYLKGLGNREYLLEPCERKTALLSLTDILFSYAYMYRTTLGEEENVEAAWTVNKLSATLSWFQSYRNVKDVKLACIRRSLTYPLYRNWDLSMKCLDDTYSIIKLGRRQILKCLICIHRLFNLSEPRYLLNQLYITDYCIWLQKLSDKKILHLASHFKKEVVDKSEVGLNLEELETAALLVQNDDIDSMTNMLSSVDLGHITDCKEERHSSSSSSEVSSGSTSSTVSESEDYDSDDLSSPES